VDDLKWKGDTCHPTPRDDGKLTCETLWVAQSSSGNYHDNMNSEIFMQWVTEKLIPTFGRLYPKNDSHCRQHRLPPQMRDWLYGMPVKEKVDGDDGDALRQIH
jgi:hypothetical protein